MRLVNILMLIGILGEDTSPTITCNGTLQNRIKGKVERVI